MKKDMKMILFPLLALILFALALFFFNSKKETTTTTPVSPKADLIRESAYSLGPKNAKVVVVEFFDPECEACAAFHPILKKILADFSGDVYFVARYMLYHGHSKEAALALEASGLQGKYWEYQDILLTRQTEWSHKEGPIDSFLEGYAKELNLNLETFKAALNEQTLKDKLAFDVSQGQALGVKGTPSFFVNGKPLMELSNDALREAIAEELKK